MAGLIALHHLRQALALPDFDPLPAQRAMAPVPRGWQAGSSAPKQAAVLILLYPERDRRLHLVLTLRQPSLRGHSGQVSFPGGRQDPEDADLTATARRETCEEIGICGGLEVLGRLAKFYIPASHYDVHPILAFRAATPAFAPNPAEVAQVFSLALEDLLNPRGKGAEQRIIRGHRVHVPYYAVKGHQVWGATAMMLSELEGRLRRVLPPAVLRTLE